MPKISYTPEDRALIQPALGQAIRARRLDLGLNPIRLAERIDRGRNFIYQVEEGYTLISLPQLVKLCHVFGCTPNDLLGWEQP